ncbi:MAG: STAS domain-containing protein [Terriglobales bacterium]
MTDEFDASLTRHGFNCRTDRQFRGIPSVRHSFRGLRNGTSLALSEAQRQWTPTRDHIGGKLLDAVLTGKPTPSWMKFSQLEEVVTGVAITTDSKLEISVDQVEKDCKVLLNGRINVDSSPDLRDKLVAILSEVPLPLTVTVDLTGVSYIETSGIATLVEALRIAGHQKTRLHLQGLTGSVLRLFEVTGVLSLFELAGREEKVS